MKIKASLPPITFIFLVFYCLVTKAQDQSLDSPSPILGYDNVISLYHQATGEHSHLYAGIEYVSYPFKLDKGHLYFNNNEWSKGNVWYDGVLYKNIPMMYDLNKGELVIVHLINNLRLQLIKEKVEGFFLQEHTFRRIERDPDNPTSPPTELYDLLYEGDLTVLAQRQKLITESATTSGLIRSVDAKTTYYLLKEGKYHRISSKKAFLEVLKDQQRKLKAYIRENKIRYRKDREGSMIRIAQFYDQLKP